MAKSHNRFDSFMKFRDHFAENCSNANESNDSTHIYPLDGVNGSSEMVNTTQHIFAFTTSIGSSFLSEFQELCKIRMNFVEKRFHDSVYITKKQSKDASAWLKIENLFSDLQRVNWCCALFDIDLGYAADASCKTRKVISASTWFPPKRQQNRRMNGKHEGNGTETNKSNF